MTARALAVACLVAVVLPAGVLARSAAAPPFVGPTLTHPAPPPDFALRDQHGRLVHLAAQHGKVVLVTFLYTHCPDACPLTAMNLNAALGALGAARKHVEVLAVSVDPQGDTPAAVASFIRRLRLRPQFHYLRGTRGVLAPLWRAYKVTAVRVGGKDVDHTLYTLLVDRSGRGRVLFDSQATARAVAHDVRLLL